MKRLVLPILFLSLVFGVFLALVLHDVTTAQIAQPVHKRTINDSGSNPDPPVDLTCSTMYYRICWQNVCIDDTGANSCCGDCRKPDGSWAPCKKCTVS